MLPIFESILPVFLVVLLGTGLKRWPLIPVGLWEGLERLGYYLLFPLLLFATLAKADFSTLETGKITVATLGMVATVTIMLFAIWPVARGLGLSASSYTSFFQATSRWNAFIALAVAEKLFGQQGLEVVAYVMTVTVLPLNIVNVGILLWHTGTGRTLKDFVRQFVRNPIIIGCLLGMGVSLLHIPIYKPLMDTIDMVTRTSLPLGLMMLGAGLRIMDALRPRLTAIWPVGLKLVVTPMIVVAIGALLGLDQVTLMTLCICGAVPTAMNGYLLAKQLGGDAPLYATITTIQTFAAFFTMPMMLSLTAQFAG